MTKKAPLPDELAGARAGADGQKLDAAEATVLLTLGQACDYLRCSRAHLYHLRTQGRLRSVEKDGRPYIRVTEIQQYARRVLKAEQA